MVAIFIGSNRNKLTPKHSISHTNTVTHIQTQHIALIHMHSHNYVHTQHPCTLMWHTSMGTLITCTRTNSLAWPDPFLASARRIGSGHARLINNIIHAHKTPTTHNKYIQCTHARTQHVRVYAHMYNPMPLPLELHLHTHTAH